MIACALLLFAIAPKAASQVPSEEKNNHYWVTETGPRANPYTIIRLYDELNNPFLEIVMNGYRLKRSPAMTERLNRLAKAADPGDAAFIATTLRIRERRVSSVKRNGEQQTFCKHSLNPPLWNH